MTDTATAPPPEAPPEAPPEPKPEPKPKKPPKPYHVELLTAVEGDVEQWELSAKVSNTGQGQKWIRENGQEGKQYRVVRVTFQCEVKTKTTTTRTLI